MRLAALSALTVAGCSSTPPENKPEAPKTYVERRNNVVVQHVNERRDPETGEATSAQPEPKPVTTRRLNAGDTKVDSRVEDSRAIPLASRVEIQTWADETIRGVLVDEKPDAYIVDVSPEEATKRTLRRVARAAVMSIRVAPGHE